jgi:hypothetical protein
MSIEVKTILVETHHSIEMIERYHESLRRIYSIIVTEISDIDSDSVLQMSFKVLNDSIESDGLVFTLLVFGAYSRMADDVLTSTITQRAIAMRKAMNKVKRFVATRQVNDALNIRNKSSTASLHDLSLNFSVLVFREGNIGHSESWKGPFRLLSIEDESMIIDLSSGSTKFRSISIKSYYQNENNHSDDSSSDQSNVLSIIEFSNQPDQTTASAVFIASVKRGRGRSRKFPASAAYISFMLNTITSPDPSFTASRAKEIVELLEKEIFESVNRNDVSTDVRIFSSRFVNEIKHPGIEKAFEKSRLVVQAFKNQNKTLVLTQSPTIQRVSQRLILCSAVMFNSEMNLYLRDII